jgi:N-sulfoglucosamine sulfohydrolase
MIMLDRARGGVFIFLAGLTLAACGADQPSGDGPPDRPNILWIIAEDLGPELGSYGHPEAYTPYLDGLASEGVRYTRAFTVAPVCSVSRSAFMTGMHAIAIDAHNHRSHREKGDNPLPEGVRVLPQWLRDAGYYSANLGDEIEGVPGSRKDDWNFSVDGPVWDSDRWTDVVAHQPFYAQINLSTTHRMGRRPNAASRIERPADPAKVQIPPYYPDHEITRKDWAEYLNTIQELDGQVGRLLDRLEADGLAYRTIVVFFGDHGRTMLRAKQWPYDSGLHIPLIIRWPTAFPAPAQISPGQVDDRLLSALDIAATTLWAAGVEHPEKMQGHTFLGPDAVENEYVFASRDRCDATVMRIRTVRSDRYRYIRNFMPEVPFTAPNLYKERMYPVLGLMKELHVAGKLTPAQEVLMAPRRPEEELYDLQNDPWEIHNLADSTDPEVQRVKAELRTALEEWIEENHDPGRTPEPKELVDEIRRKDEEFWATWTPPQ